MMTGTKNERKEAFETAEDLPVGHIQGKEEGTMTELKDGILEQVTGGASVAKNDDPVKYCKCGKMMKYLGQHRIEGGTTGKFQCENPDCTERYIVKDNLGNPITV